jgi:hypothetical protein
MANKSWDELKESGAILAKGARKPKLKPPPEDVSNKKRGMTCSNCGKPVSINAPDRCNCSIWEVGKRRKT